MHERSNCAVAAGRHYAQEGLYTRDRREKVGLGRLNALERGICKAAGSRMTWVRSRKVEHVTATPVRSQGLNLHSSLSKRRSIQRVVSPRYWALRQKAMCVYHDDGKPLSHAVWLELGEHLVSPLQFSIIQRTRYSTRESALKKTWRQMHNGLEHDNGCV